MKICWENLESLVYVRKLDLWRKKSIGGYRTYFIYKSSCISCGAPYLTPKKKPSSFCGRKCANSGVNNGYYGHRDINFNKKQLEILYWAEERSIVEIADIFGCGKSTIYRRLREFNIKVRTPSERQSLTNSKLWASGSRNLNSIGICSLYETPYGETVQMRSQWEVKVADYLTSINEEWFYEPDTLNLGEGIWYIPDFYLPNKDEYVEVKGWKSDASMKKFNLAKLKYNISLWDEDKLKKMGIIGG